jgi:hypothetical protein
MTRDATPDEWQRAWQLHYRVLLVLSVTAVLYVLHALRLTSRSHSWTAPLGLVLEVFGLAWRFALYASVTSLAIRFTGRCNRKQVVIKHALALVVVLLAALSR